MGVQNGQMGRYLGVVLLVAATAGLSEFLVARSQVSVLQNRVRPEQLGPDVGISLPLADGFGLERALLRVAAAAGVGLGLERVIDQPLPDRVARTRHSPSALQAGGRPIGDVLGQLLAAAPVPVVPWPGLSHHFTLAEKRGLVHVTQLGTRETFLDRTVESFELTDGTLADVAVTIHRLWDSAYPSPSGSLAFGTIDGREATMARRISLSLGKVTVRDLLDETVRAHGEMSWVVRYHDPSSSYAECHLEFAAFNGWRQAFAARR